AFGRRARERGGPRELELDLLVFGRVRLAIERPPRGPIDRPSQGCPGPHGAPPGGSESPVRAGTPGGSGTTAGATGLGRDRGFGAPAAGAPGGPGRRSAGRDVGRDDRALDDYSLTLGGLFRSNMWTVSTKRTCLLR